MIDFDQTTPVDIRLRQALESGTLPKQLMIDSAAGTGKTYSILKVLHCLLADYPDLRALICRQTRASLTESVCVTYEQEILPADGMESIAFGQQRRTRRSYDYPNGSTLVLGGLDQPDRVLSTAWDIILVNECIEVSEEAWDALWGRLNRPGRPRGFGFLLGDTNPGDPSHFLKKRADEKEIGRWQVDHKANPVMWNGWQWTPEGHEYIVGVLGKLKGTRRKRFLDGVWAAGEGQWFECFDSKANVTTAAKYDSAYPVHLAIDSGVYTGAVWFQIKIDYMGEPSVYVFAEYTAFNKPAFTVGEEIVAKSKAMGLNRIDRTTTDPAGKAATAVGPTVIGEYRRAGLYPEFWPSYPGSVLDGLSLIDSFVSVEPAGLFVHPDCKGLIEAMANYKRVKRAGHFIDRPVDEQHPYEDIMDPLRGGLQDKWPYGRKPRARSPIVGGPKYSDLATARYH